MGLTVVSNRTFIRSAEQQHTLKHAISCVGVGLHSGIKTTLTLRPAAANTGITFVRTDLPAGTGIIPALWNHVTDTRLCTLISNEHKAAVGTIEHVMSALRGCSIDNVIVEVDGPEVPVMDGSAAPFVFLIECAGSEAQGVARRALRILRDVTYTEGNKSATLSPAPASSFSLDIDFASAAIARQEGYVWLTDSSFKTDICRARTFGFLHEIEQLRSMGLARGGSPENAIIIDGDRVMNEDGLRYTDEFVRHKILDSVGDLYLAGGPIIGHFHGVRSGHAMNNRLLHALFAQPDAWVWEDGVAIEATEPMAAIA